MSTTMEPENANQQTMKLRPRRSALSDISNTFAQHITNMTKRITTKKRKYSEEIAVTEVHESTVTETSQADQPEPLINNPLVAAPDLSHPTENIKDIVHLKKKSSEEIEFENYGFNLPKKQKRRINYQLKGSNPCECYDILDDMYAIYSEQEPIYTPKSYLTTRTDISAKMRTILIDWLMEVHYKYKLQPATIWLCVNILDRYLEIENVPRNRLQLVGITAFFIACKFEEIHGPEVKDCVYLTDSAYTRADILEMEGSILNRLNYQLLVPTGFHFLTIYLNKIKASERVRLIASYIAERNMQEMEFLDYSPRLYTAAAVYIALKTVIMGIENPPVVWTRPLIEETGYHEEELLSCARMMIAHNSDPPQATSRRKLEAVKKKYLLKCNQNVSSLEFPVI